MKLPCDTCGAKCCTHAPFNLKEFEKIRHLIPEGSSIVDVGHAFVIYKKGSDDVCAFLDDNKLCTIYSKRPHTCRDYGEKPTLPCAQVNPGRAQYLLNKQADKLKKKSSTLHPNLKKHL